MSANAAAQLGLMNHDQYVLAISEIINMLIKAYEAKVPINLTRIKNDISRKHKLPYIPKLVDIIAAVPEDYKSKLLPYIKAKPVRTASGVAVVAGAVASVVAVVVASGVAVAAVSVEAGAVESAAITLDTKSVATNVRQIDKYLMFMFKTPYVYEL